MKTIVLTTLLELIAPKGLDTNGTLGPMLVVHPLQLTDHNTGISLLLSTSAWVLLSPKDGVAKEGRPKFNPRPGRGLNPGPPGWQSEI